MITKQTKFFKPYQLYCEKIKIICNLFQWDKPRTVSSTNTRPSVLDWFVCDAEFSQIMTNHFRLKNSNLVNCVQLNNG